MIDALVSPLIQPDSLASRLADGDDALAIVDTRCSLTDPAAGEAAWREAHLPGAVYADLERDLSGPRAPGAGRHPWPGAPIFRARLGEWGITPATDVVVYDAGDGAYAARLWWLLRALGHRRVSVLDGGWAGWTQAGLPVTDEVREPVAHEYPAADFDRSLLLDAAGVQRHLEEGGLLIDARAGERYRGEIEPIDPVAGHVPGALNRPYLSNLESGRFKPVELLRDEFAALLGENRPDDVVVMCGSGVTACHHLLALEAAGLPGAKLFTGSWSGWVEDPQRPVATGA